MFVAQVIGAVVVAALATALVLALAQARTLAKWIALSALTGAVVAGAFAVAAEIRYRSCLDWNRANVRRAYVGGMTIVRGDSPPPRRCERD